MSRGSAITQKLPLSEELADLVGKDEMSRGDVMKKVWAYIKKHDLQDEDDRRVINPDDRLGAVIGHRPINMLKMTAAISKHIG